jgi:nucleoside-diphosphate-sugar epimerase
VRRFVLLSTAAVYGDGVFAGIGEDEVVPAPVSAPSRYRRAAELRVLAAGGTVLRPMYVHGPGDTWFVPAVRTVGQVVPYRVNGGSARLSVIGVDDLARALLAAAHGRVGPGVWHAVHPEPVTLGQILDALGLPATAPPRSYAETVADLGLDPDLARRLAHVTHDRWFAGARLWAAAGVAPGAPLAGLAPG